MKRKETLYTIIGAAIKKHRKEAGISQEKLAEVLDIGRTSLVNIENGYQRIQIDTLYRIALTLGIDITFLIPKASNDVLENIDDLYTQFLLERFGVAEY